MTKTDFRKDNFLSRSFLPVLSLHALRQSFAVLSHKQTSHYKKLPPMLSLRLRRIFVEYARRRQRFLARCTR